MNSMDSAKSALISLTPGSEVVVYASLSSILAQTQNILILEDRIAQTTNFVEGGEKTFTSDLHGTAVAGVIGARADDNFGISGIAPDVDLLAVKACWHRQPKRSEAWCSSWTLARHRLRYVERRVF